MRLTIFFCYFFFFGFGKSFEEIFNFPNFLVIPARSVEIFFPVTSWIVSLTFTSKITIQGNNIIEEAEIEGEREREER